ncbi:hypothetical protein BN946_scf184945.g20 [Trametes cinnabarina]|uniref:Uncharacterized protein n=1 Tax=Pycnoporus cinnabarinus TaxID=5643 RepID=A0A060SR76_PYCCI|nr:hypothetical protein BN946_scf184945.g20 [Trametes cinnabarina]
MAAQEDGALVCSPECDHTFCPPPRLIYSPASSSSLASDTPPPITPLGPSLCPNVGFPLLSPAGSKFLDSTPLPDGFKAGSTLAERRGAKALALAKSPTFSDVPQPKFLSPRTPDTPSSFAQRIFDFIRSPTPDTVSICESPSPEYTSDPFGGTSPSFFDDPCLFDSDSVRPHPDLYDLNIYQYHARRPHLAVVKNGPKHGTARLYVGVSDIELKAEVSVAVSPPHSQKHPSAFVPSPSTPAPSLDRHLPEALSAAPIPPPSLPPPSHSYDIRSAPAPVVRRLSTASLPSSPLPYLRPLLLPQKLVRREIADAQSASILPHATRTLRPLILPLELARRATHPARHARIRPRPASYPHSVARSRPYHIPINRHGMAAVNASSPASITPRMDTVTEEGGGEEERGSRAEYRRSQQLDDIISLLDESGIIHVLRTGDGRDAVSAEHVLSDSDESAGLATPPSILSRPGTSSSYSFVSQPQEDPAQEIVETSVLEASKVDDILELLDVQREDAVVKQGDDEAVEEEAADELICAYAI